MIYAIALEKASEIIVMPKVKPVPDGCAEATMHQSDVVRRCLQEMRLVFWRQLSGDLLKRLTKYGWVNFAGGVGLHGASGKQEEKCRGSQISHGWPNA
nr:hypothetical protein [Pseudoxanthomonas suwonensis]